MSRRFLIIIGAAVTACCEMPNREAQLSGIWAPEGFCNTRSLLTIRPDHTWSLAQEGKGRWILEGDTFTLTSERTGYSALGKFRMLDDGHFSFREGERTEKYERCSHLP